jgi:cation diffusion facilitator CzcD-associated flavoprotein CzcO
MAKSQLGNDCQVAVIGAGPYGLAVTAHLNACGVATHAFGQPMSFWRYNMPKGMKLRSPWRASDISAPGKALSLDSYSQTCGVARIEPFPIADFVGYGDWFQMNAVPELDTRVVSRVEATANGFCLATSDGDRISARGVVIATGLKAHEFRPAPFALSPTPLISHTSEHAHFEGFRNQRVAVIGRGQSACETAALVTEAGAEAEIICRGPIRWLGASDLHAGCEREIRARVSALLASPSAIGRFPLSWGVEMPSLLRLLPQDGRNVFNALCLRAAAAGWLRPRFGNVSVRSGAAIARAAANGERIELQFDGGDSAAFDRVILATGYKFDVARLAVLAPELKASIHCRDGSPVLSSSFESSMPGLFFVGASAVSSFGPLLRFIAGTGFAAGAVTRAIVAERKSSRLPRDRAEYGLAT